MASTTEVTHAELDAALAGVGGGGGGGATWLPANVFDVRVGATMGKTGTGEVWVAKLSDDSYHYIETNVYIAVSPAKFTLYWTANAGGAGDVKFEIKAYPLGNNDSLSAAAVNVLTGIDAVAANDIVKATVVNASQVIGIKPYNLVLGRQGPDGADTAPGEVQIIGILIEAA